jgi:SAM-dependent methyltransferase
MTGIDLEYPDCPVCGCPEHAVLYQGGAFAPFAVRVCRVCGMQYLSPRPSEQAMLAVYAADYFGPSAAAYADYAAQELSLRATFRRLLRTLAARSATGGALLEIGCAHGLLLDEARPWFTRRVGTEYSGQAAARAASRADAVHVGGLDAVPAGETFDCVIATQVIEHAYHPRAFVRDVIERLRPGGRLVVATPDAGSAWRRLMGRRWPSFKVPEHVSYFERRTLARILTDAGVSSVEVVPYPHAFPLSLVGAKAGMRVPAALGHITLWLPATTLALMGTCNG